MWLVYGRYAHPHSPPIYEGHVMGQCENQHMASLYKAEDSLYLTPYLLLSSILWLQVPGLWFLSSTDSARLLYLDTKNGCHCFVSQLFVDVALAKIGRQAHQIMPVRLQQNPLQLSNCQALTRSRICNLCLAIHAKYFAPIRQPRAWNSDTQYLWSWIWLGS